MQKILKSSSRLFVVFMLLPITPTFAVITVFAQTLLIDRKNEVSIILEHPKRVIDAIRNEPGPF